MHLKIFVTYGCNLRCAHCVQARIRLQAGHRTDAEVEEQLRGFIASARAQTQDLHIYLSGGEPLLSPRFYMVAGVIRQEGLSYKTITNGLLLGNRWRKLLMAPPEGIWITFNGTGNLHNRMVGLKGAYERLLHSLRVGLPELQRCGVRAGAVLMINPLTHDRLTKDVEEIARLGFSEIVVQHLSFLTDSVIARHRAAYRAHFGGESRFCFGEGADGTGIDPTRLAHELSAIRGRDYPFRLIIFPPLYEPAELADYYGKYPRQWQQRRCPRALHELWVHPDGGVTTCFGHPVGHIRQSFDAIRASPELKQWQERFQQLEAPLPGCMRCHRLYMERVPVRTQ